MKKLVDFWRKLLNPTAQEILDKAKVKCSKGNHTAYDIPNRALFDKYSGAKFYCLSCGLLGYTFFNGWDGGHGSFWSDNKNLDKEDLKSLQQVFLSKEN